MKLRALRKNRQIIWIINKQISKSKKINQIGSNTAYIWLNRSGDRNCTEYADKHSIMNKGRSSSNIKFCLNLFTLFAINIKRI